MSNSLADFWVHAAVGIQDAPPPTESGSAGSGLHGEPQRPPLTEPYGAINSLSQDFIQALTPEGCSPAEFYAALQRTARGLDEAGPEPDE